MSRSISQLFLGVRIECAQCHHHPSEKWGQDDYFALAGFFTGVQTQVACPAATRPSSSGRRPISNHPRTGKPVPARALGARPADFSGDRRPPQRARRLDDRRRQPVLRPRHRQSALGALFRPRPGRAARRPPRHQPRHQRAAARRARQRISRAVKFDLKAFTRTLLNSRALSARTEDESRQRRATSKTSRTPGQDAPGRGAARRDLPGDRRSREVQRLAEAAIRADPGLGQPDAVVLLPHLRPAGASERLRVRTAATSRASPRPCT